VRTSSSLGERVEAGKASGGTGYTLSPLTRSGARLVAITTSPGQASIRAATSDAAPSRCSKLSRTTRKLLSPRRSLKAS
jgi:hypothetical protein